MKNNNNKDKYLVYVRDDKSRMYYKNDTLHREAGPAIIPAICMKDYVPLPDEKLYTEIFDAEEIKIKNTNKPARSVAPFLDYFVLEYYLEGIQYSEQEFNAITLNKKLEQELSNQGQQTKKMKM